MKPGIVYLDDIGDPPTPEQIEKLKVWFENLVASGVKFETYSTRVSAKDLKFEISL